jgi:phosphomethylpyrimidine synthase
MNESRQYATQMEAARLGIETEALTRAAAREGIPTPELAALVASGRAALPANRLHASLEPRAVGRALSTKINVNLGTSADASDSDAEMEKVRLAVELGADAIMDLSSSGDTRPFRRALVAASTAMIGNRTRLRRRDPIREAPPRPL